MAFIYTTNGKVEPGHLTHHCYSTELSSPFDENQKTDASSVVNKTRRPAGCPAGLLEGNLCHVLFISRDRNDGRG